MGKEVEAVVRSAGSGKNVSDIVNRVAPQFEGRAAGSLNDRVYEFGLLLSQLREGRVGRYAPNKPIPRPVSR